MLVVEWKRICTGLKKNCWLVYSVNATINNISVISWQYLFINVMPNEIQISRMKDRDPIKRLYNGTS